MTSDRLWTLWLPLSLALALAALGAFAPAWYAAWLNDEQGGVEMGQWLVLLAALGVALVSMGRPEARARPWLLAWLALAAVACLYVAGEEVSWGQHLLNWNTPEYWKAVNDQGETNLHNVSSWLDQKPRALLELGVVLGGLVAPAVRRLRPGLLSGPLDLLAPTAACLPVALLAELAGASKRLGFELFFRPSEVQELFFYLFVLIYLVELGRRMERWETRR